MALGRYVGVYATTTRTSGNAGANSIYLTPVTVPKNGTVAAVLLDAFNAVSSIQIKAVIYDGAHSALLASGSIVTSLAQGYNRLQLTAPLSVTAGTQYYVGYVTSNSINVTVQTAGGPTSWWASGGQSVASPANPLATGSTATPALTLGLELDNTGVLGSGWGVDSGSTATFSGTDNRTVTFTATTNIARSTTSLLGGGGRYYAEIIVGGALHNSYSGIGLAAVDYGITQAIGGVSASPSYYAFVYPLANTNLSGVTLGFGSYIPGDVIGIAWDSLNNRLWWNKNNGSWYGGASVGDPVIGTNSYPFNPQGWPVTIIVQSSNAAGVFTLADTAAMQSFAPPSGYTAWSGGGTPVTINALIASIAREALVTGTGFANIGGLVREALIGGYRIETQVKSTSSMQAQLTVTGGVTTIAGGAGGGGAAGLFGPGEFGQNGVYDGTGGYGGAADDYLTPRQLTPSTIGNAGHEWDGTYGSGSGGSGGSWGGTGHGGDGGVGGLYGGGGGGGGGGHSGGGAGGLGGEGVIYLEYDPGTGPIVIILTKDSPDTFTIPLDWSTTNNTVLIVGAGGCGAPGGLTTGGGGGGGGDVVGAVNTGLYTPGQVISIDIPSAADVCAGLGGNTHFGSNSAAPGTNGNGSTAGGPSVPYTPSEGGIGHGGGGTGVIGGGSGGPATGGAGGGVAVLVASRIEGKSLSTSDMLARAISPRQHAVSVQTWHW